MVMSVFDKRGTPRPTLEELPKANPLLDQGAAKYAPKLEKFQICAYLPVPTRLLKYAKLGSSEKSVAKTSPSRGM
jgi:hypothetical protein